MSADVAIPPVAPKVYLIGRQSLVYSGLKAFADDHGLSGPDGFQITDLVDDFQSEGAALAEISGRIDYWSFERGKRRPGGSRAYFERILEQHHTNIIEIPHWTTIWRCSMATARELLRYRTAERSQTSTRYVDYSEVPIIVLPGEGYTIASEAWRDNYRWAYEDAMERGAKKGKKGTTLRKWARSKANRRIPMSAATWVVLSHNLQTSRHIITQRANTAADDEFRRLALDFYEVMRAEAPNVFLDMERVPSDDDIDSVRTITLKEDK